MRTPKAIIAALFAVQAHLAAAQMPHAFTAGSVAKASEVNENFAYLMGLAPRVYWQVSPTCDHACDITATSLTFPNPNGYTEVASLNLPAGAYVVEAKLATYPTSSVQFGDLECTTGVSGGPADFGSVGVLGSEKMVHMILPLVTTGASTKVALGCRLFGTQTDGTSLITAQMWGARIVAISVAAVSQQQ